MLEIGHWPARRRRLLGAGLITLGIVVGFWASGRSGYQLVDVGSSIIRTGGFMVSSVLLCTGYTAVVRMTKRRLACMDLAWIVATGAGLFLLLFKIDSTMALET